MTRGVSCWGGLKKKANWYLISWSKRNPWLKNGLLWCSVIVGLQISCTTIKISPKSRIPATSVDKFSLYLTLYELLDLYLTLLDLDLTFINHIWPYWTFVRPYLTLIWPYQTLSDLIDRNLTFINQSDLGRDDPWEREADPEEPEGGEDSECAEGLWVAGVRRQRVADGHVPAEVTQWLWVDFRY